MDQPFLHDIHTDQFNASRALGKSPGDVFVVNHHVPKGFTPNQLGVKVRFLEAGQCTRPNFVRAHRPARGCPVQTASR